MSKATTQDVADRIDALSSYIATIAELSNKRFDAIEAKIDALEAKIDALEAGAALDRAADLDDIQAAIALGFYRGSDDLAGTAHSVFEKFQAALNGAADQTVAAEFGTMITEILFEKIRAGVDGFVLSAERGQANEDAAGAVAELFAQGTAQDIAAAAQDIAAAAQDAQDAQDAAQDVAPAQDAQDSAQDWRASRGWR